MDTGLAGRVVSIVRGVTAAAGPLALHEPTLGAEELDCVSECVNTGWVSSVGKFVDLFEERLAHYHGVERAVAVVNGTAALHVSLLLAGVQPGDEVLVPAITFVATANAVTYARAIPHFVESEARSFGIDVMKLDRYLASVAVRQGGETINRDTGRPIRAIVPVHVFGLPVDMDPLMDLAARYGLVVVEDAAESLGSLYRGRKTGTFGKLAALSFNGNKIITTGGGGAILTNDAELGRRAKHLTTTARQAHAWEYVHDELGFNYRLPNINAALGVAQLGKLDRFIESKRRLSAAYRLAFAGVPGVQFCEEPAYSRSNGWLNAITVAAPERDTVLARCHAEGILCRPIWRLLSSLPMYRECPRMPLPTAEHLEATTINLPSSAHLGQP